jgi:hypothetical protein
VFNINKAHYLTQVKNLTFLKQLNGMGRGRRTFVDDDDGGDSSDAAGDVDGDEDDFEGDPDLAEEARLFRGTLIV